MTTGGCWQKQVILIQKEKIELQKEQMASAERALGLIFSGEADMPVVVDDDNNIVIEDDDESQNATNYENSDTEMIPEDVDGDTGS